MHNNESPPLTDKELKEAFAFYAEIFKADDAEKKFFAASTMLLQLDGYLRNKIEGLDTSSILAVFAEYAYIQNGGEAEFIKCHKKRRGQPPDIVHQTNEANIVASIDILSKHGYAVHEAISFVASTLKREKQEIKQLRSDYNRRKKLSQAKDHKRQTASINFPSKEDAEKGVLVLLQWVKDNPPKK